MYFLFLLAELPHNGLDFTTRALTIGLLRDPYGSRTSLLCNRPTVSYAPFSSLLLLIFSRSSYSFNFFHVTTDHWGPWIPVFRASELYRHNLQEFGVLGWLSRYNDGILARWQEFVPRQGQEIFSSQQCPYQIWGPPSLRSSGYRGYVKVTTRVLLVPRSKMVELYLHSPYAFMASCLIN
jgi:hypothetical protein